MRTLAFVFAAASLLLSMGVHADQVDRGVATRCDPENRTFEINPVVVLSSESKGAIPLKAGHTQLSEGIHEVGCRLRSQVVAGTIRIVPPQAKGLCMGAGHISVVRLTLDDAPIIARRTSFNWYCPGHRTLIGISVRVERAGLVVEKCTADDWGWPTGFTGIECTKEKYAR